MTATVSTSGPVVDLTAIKAKQQINWSAGNYAVIGTTLQLIGESICEAVDVSAGWRVLDVAAGNGNASLAAARRGCDVVAIDYVPELLDGLRARAAAEGLAIRAETGDAEAINAADASFDAVLSTLGVMFAPNQDQAAAELARVCRPGGRIGLANWAPSGFIGAMFRTIGKHVPPPAGLRSPMEWGTEPRLQELFGDTVSSLSVVEKDFIFRYRSAEDFLVNFKSFYGPMVKAFEALDDDGRANLAADLVALADEHNTATDGTLRIPSTYVEVVAVRAS